VVAKQNSEPISVMRPAVLINFSAGIAVVSTRYFNLVATYFATYSERIK
jgi:hypothetical protein